MSSPVPLLAAQLGVHAPVGPVGATGHKGSPGLIGPSGPVHSPFPTVPQAVVVMYKNVTPMLGVTYFINPFDMTGVLYGREHCRDALTGVVVVFGLVLNDHGTHVRVAEADLQHEPNLADPFAYVMARMEERYGHDLR